VDEVRSYLLIAMLHAVSEVVDHKHLSSKAVITESFSQCVPDIILEKLIVERAAFDFEAQFPFEPGGHGRLVLRISIRSATVRLVRASHTVTKLSSSDWLR
jgi:hypothetical protein